MAVYPDPNPPMCVAEIYCPEGPVRVSRTELYNNILAFQCEKFTENPAGSWYMVLKDTRLVGNGMLKQRIVSKSVIKVWMGRHEGVMGGSDQDLVWMGIVDGVAENEHVSAKSNYTELVITGRCLGGALIDLPVFFQSWGEGFDKWWSYSIDLKAARPDIWMRNILQDFVWTNRGCNTPWGTRIPDRCIEEIPIPSLQVRPQHASSAWSLMEQAMLRPWTETFIQVSGPDAGCLVHRVKPWNGAAVHPDGSRNVAAPPRVSAPITQGRHIRRENFIGQKTHISDEDYYNHIMVNTANNLMAYGVENVDACGGNPTGGGGTGGGTSDGACPIPGCPEPVKNPGEMSMFGCAEDRECQSRYGIRSLRLNFNLGYPAAYNQEYDVPQENATTIAEDLLKWYNRPYERAEITVRGDIYMLGMVIPDYHVTGWNKMWYIEGVSHDYVYGDHWYTTIHGSEYRPQPHNWGWGLAFCNPGGSSPGSERGTFRPVRRL